jgi:uncharacterized Fe-S cluster-containing radical SAM superfamily protein
VQTIDTDGYSHRLRDRTLQPGSRQLLVADLRGSTQEADLQEPVNCGGVGRIRHFQRAGRPGWPPNPLPIDPACRALGMPRVDDLRAQVFQLASCNWRCWYCYVPYHLLAARPQHAQWLDAGELLDRWAAEPAAPRVVVLSGGQPDLVPEWAPWMLTALAESGLLGGTYLWSDDNLSNDYFWRFLDHAQIELLVSSSHYGRVCCFKGFDADSFAFNTRAAPELFTRQFDLFARLLRTGIDLFAYATFTTASERPVADAMARFVDRLQAISVHLPLRVVPLEVQVWSTVEPRLRAAGHAALLGQRRAVEAWQAELEARFTAEERGRDITQVPLDPPGGEP